jgi:hypothetical protein
VILLVEGRRHRRHVVVGSGHLPSIRQVLLRSATQQVIGIGRACPGGIDIVLIFVSLNEARARVADYLDELRQGIRHLADPGLTALARGSRAETVGEAVGVAEARSGREWIADEANVAKIVVLIGRGQKRTVGIAPALHSRCVSSVDKAGGEIIVMLRSHGGSVRA